MFKDEFKRTTGQRRTLCALFDGADGQNSRLPKRAVFKCLKMVASTPSISKGQVIRTPSRHNPSKRSFLSCFNNPAKRRCIRNPFTQNKNEICHDPLQFQFRRSSRQRKQLSPRRTASRWSEFDDHETAKGHERFSTRSINFSSTSKEIKQSLCDNFEQMQSRQGRTKQKSRNRRVPNAKCGGSQSKRGRGGNTKNRRDQHQSAITSFMSQFIGESKSLPVDLTSPSLDLPIATISNANSTRTSMPKHFGISNKGGCPRAEKLVEVEPETCKNNRQRTFKQMSPRSLKSKHTGRVSLVTPADCQQIEFWEAIQTTNCVSVSNNIFYAFCYFASLTMYYATVDNVVLGE